MKHSALPWQITPNHYADSNEYEVWDKDGNYHKDLSREVSDANAEFMTNAVNSHQAMKEALEAIIARIDGAFDHPSLLKQGPLSIGHNDDVRKIAKQALTLANGGTIDE